MSDVPNHLPKTDWELDHHLLLAEVRFCIEPFNHRLGINQNQAFAHHAQRLNERIPEWIQRYNELTKSVKDESLPKS
ncbi:hypothetical protein [Tahibacter sp.]|uniref:hypothetical protein n=1 Tax=Tahibacter sp. TaxID=2056211 RepID=UPI0028C4CE32|nr:hypothetical protein [Tahibacter sp.]